MKLAKDFRASAREALKGKWGLAVIAGVIASLLGAGGGASLNIDLGEESGSSVDTELSERLAGVIEQYLPVVIGIVLVGLLFALAVGFALSIISSSVSVGYCIFNLELIDGKPASLGTLFSYFTHFWKAFVTLFLRGLYIFLWTLLFIIPGIIATYNYALVPYIIAEDTEISASDALRKSKELMYGNRWRFFCLEFSFIGWYLLAALTLGIGALWVNPYRAAAFADFYREISDTRPVIETETEDCFDEFSEQTSEF